MNPASLDRKAVLDTLKGLKGTLHQLYGVTALGVFGSLARGEARPGSDVDVVVQMRDPKLFYLVHIKKALEEALQVRVDVVRYREKMNPSLKRRIERDAVYV